MTTKVQGTFFSHLFLLDESSKIRKKTTSTPTFGALVLFRVKITRKKGEKERKNGVREKREFADCLYALLPFNFCKTLYLYIKGQRSFIHNDDDDAGRAACGWLISFARVSFFSRLENACCVTFFQHGWIKRSGFYVSLSLEPRLVKIRFEIKSKWWLSFRCKRSAIKSSGFN